ncbi:GNAT family acetyltransferase [Colletotrichum musicola]|uniref:GNAT family acetyltransferase n=1 Tax=Colletotrichum musicola TaxID=2175873 RepID=A0A8H6U8H7_9PEZI|nr:GNAT family acetyltransferase [Colletotrichum musicola]
MSSPQNAAKTDLWLEPFSEEDHLQDFHEICSDEPASFWSTQPPTVSLEDSVHKMRTIYARNPQKPWLAIYAVMSSEYPGPDAEPTTKMIGMVRTSQPSPCGLMFGYKIRSDCWGQGYGTRAVKMFLDEYWKEPRWAPRGEVFAAPRRLSVAARNPSPPAGSVTDEASASVNDEASPMETDEASSLETDDASSTSANVFYGWEGKYPEFGGDDADMIIDIKHLIASVDLGNEGSMRVARKCGGKHVAVDRESVKVWRFGEKRDMAIWRMDRPGSG